MKLPTLFGALFLAASCATTTAEERPEKVGGVELTSRAATEQMVIFITPDDQEFICLAPAPDSGRDRQESFSIGSKLGESGGVTTTALGGRTGLVLITRELFYRSCEFSRNYNLSKDEALALYHKQLDLLRSIAGDVPAELVSDNDDSDQDDDS